MDSLRQHLWTPSPPHEYSARCAPSRLPAPPPPPASPLQELLRRHVLKLLRIWRGWFIFSDDYLNGLQARQQRLLSPSYGFAAVVR